MILYLQSSEPILFRLFAFSDEKPDFAHFTCESDLPSQVKHSKLSIEISGKNCMRRNSKTNCSMSQEPGLADNCFFTEIPIEKNSNKSLSADVSTLDDKVCDEWIKFYVSDSRFIFAHGALIVKQTHKKSQSQVNLANS